MKLLLDTRVVIWWREDNPRLNGATRKAIGEAELAFVSAASAWEVSIKTALGKLEIKGSFGDGVEQSGFSKLDVTFAHAAAVTHLPHHHGDPLDRMLIAQALVEGLTLVTHDPRFRPYRVPVLWV